MSEALETPCGRVKISPPSASWKYWRVEFFEHGKRRQSSGGLTLETAKVKAAEVVARLDRASEPLGRTRLDETLTRYLAWGESQWSRNHFIVTNRELAKISKEYGRLRCEQLDVALLRQICNRAVSASSAKAQRSRLKAFLLWGHSQSYFTPEQKESLGSYTWVPVAAPLKRPKRKAERGSIEVQPDEVPSHAQVIALGEALDSRLPYGRLMIELAAGSGLRISELLALKADHIVADSRRIHVREQVLGVRNEDGSRLAPPKMNKTRVAIFPEVAATGYKLAEALDARIREVHQEHARGENDLNLLFPAKRGGYWWSTGFTNDEFSPAAELAKWPALTWKEKGKTRRQWIFTMHSLRHRFATDCLELWKMNPAELTEVGGWESIMVVFTRYYGRSADLLEKVFEKTSHR